MGSLLLGIGGGFFKLSAGGTCWLVTRREFDGVCPAPFVRALTAAFDAEQPARSAVCFATVDSALESVFLSAVTGVVTKQGGRVWRTIGPSSVGPSRIGVLAIGASRVYGMLFSEGVCAMIGDCTGNAICSRVFSSIPSASGFGDGVVAATAAAADVAASGRVTAAAADVAVSGRVAEFGAFARLSMLCDILSNCSCCCTVSMRACGSEPGAAGL
jgi:hypothetical protein